MNARRRVHPGAPRGLPALPRRATRADAPLYLIGPELYEDYRPLAKDIRALRAEQVAPRDRGVGTVLDVDVLDGAGAAALAARARRR